MIFLSPIRAAILNVASWRSRSSTLQKKGDKSLYEGDRYAAISADTLETLTSRQFASLKEGIEIKYLFIYLFIY